MTDFMSPGIISDAIRTVFTFFDTIFFWLLQGVYQVFFNVSTAELFSNALIRDFYYRCQLVIGVFMLFKLSVTILEGIMDPARITDKKAGAGKIISRIITSLVILALITPINIPSPQNKWERQVNNNGLLFGALYSLQERILSNNTIGKLVLGTTDGVTDADEQGQTLSESAKQFAGKILRGFFRINVVPEPDDGYDVETGQDPEVNKDYRFCDFTEEQEQFYNTATPAELLSAVNDTCEIDSNSSWFQELGEKISSILSGKETYYRYSYSPIAGIVALIISVILILYTIDVAIRALKLAILRLIAPIPIISHMSISAKEGKGEDAFSSWVRSLTSTYLELFIRLAIMYFVIYLINDMIANGIVINTGTGMVGILSFVFIVIGIFIFAKQAPKFIEHSLGMKGSAGIGATIAAAGIGSLIGGGDRNAVLDSMREAARTVQNGGKDPGPGILKTYRDNQVKKILDKANQGMQNEFYKRGLDIDDQDEIRRDKKGNIIDPKKPNHWWQGKKRSILGFEMGADVLKAQTISEGLSNNQKRYQANWATHERATGRGNTVRGGSEFHTRTDSYPTPTPAGQPGTTPSGGLNPNPNAEISSGLGNDEVGGTGYMAGQANQSNIDTSTPSPDVAPDRPYDMGPPPGGFGGPGGPGGPPPGF
ncbi:MAG: hypothetical protein UE699_04775 [Bacilli bacterium]|nr:hypothetical protein [Bacilli bacterium]